MIFIQILDISFGKFLLNNMFYTKNASKLPITEKKLQQI